MFASLAVFNRALPSREKLEHLHMVCVSAPKATPGLAETWPPPHLAHLGTCAFVALTSQRNKLMLQGWASGIMPCRLAAVA